MIALLRYVALRHLWSAKLRSLLTVFGVALGVAMVVGTTAANRAVTSALEELTDRAAGRADLEITADESGADQSLVELVGDRRDLAAHVAGRIEQTTLLEDDTRLLVIGLDFLGDLAFAPFQSKEGGDPFRDALGFVNDPYAILITESLATSRGLKVGSILKLRTARGLEDFHVEAILRETGSSRAFGGQVVILSLDAAQLAFAREGKVDRIDVELPKGMAFEKGKSELAALIGDRGKVDRPSKRATSLARMTAAFQGGLQVTAAVAVLVGMFLVANAIGVAVAQRRREIGILRGLGATRRAVVLVFLGEALFLGLIGGALGVVMGAGLARNVVKQFGPNVSRFFETIATPTVTISPRLVLFGLALGAFASVLSALGPARRAASVAPSEALRRELSPVAARRGALVIVALVMVLFAAVVIVKRTAGMGLVSLLCLFFAATAISPMVVTMLSRWLARPAGLLGVPARLGVEGVGRSIGRSASTVAALTLATALGLTLSAYTHAYEKACLDWIEQAIPADIVVSAGSPLMDRWILPLTPDVKSKVEGPEVEAVNLVRAISVPYGDLRVEVTSLESETYLGRLLHRDDRRVIRGPKKLPVDALSKEPSILISENFAWKTGLEPGSFVELPTPSGGRKFRVVAVVVDYSNDQGWMLIDRKWAIEYWKDARVEAVHVYLKPGVDPLVAAEAIRKRAGPGTFVTTNEALKREIRAVVEQTFGISRAAETIALIVAVLGVIGTMIATVLDRQRELGVLRALGALRRQVVLAIVVEAAMLGACAAILAMVVAIPAAKVFVDVVAYQASGWSVPFSLPILGWLRVAFTVTACAALAGLLPGIRASRVVLSRALAWD
ncbi:MAG: ABC transporter permease [Polyangiales bacterium]